MNSNPAIVNMGQKRYLSIACSNGGSGTYGSSVGSSQLRFDISILILILGHKHLLIILK